jgi:hypothetical protein
MCIFKYCIYIYNSTRVETSTLVPTFFLLVFYYSAHFAMLVNLTYLFGLILLACVQRASAGSMPSTGSLCTIITSTNLNSLYGWSCSSGDDCDSSTSVFEQTPVSGVCSGNNLVSLDLSNAGGTAGLTGTIPAFFSTSSKPLSRIELQTNKLTGSIPTNLAAIHTTLTYLDVRSNKLTGTVPSELCSGITLNTLKFSDNSGLTCYEDCLSTVSNKDYGSVPVCGGKHVFVCLLAWCCSWFSFGTYGC